jgi:rare lipoprotein A
VKGRMMLFAVSILSFEFSPTIVTPSAAGQAGIASVYSYESGSRTASGQKLNHEALTAAHRTLPFGSKVKVTNKRNGRTVVVTINDRGPFVRGRVIDVSPAAAQELGFTGLAQVSIDNPQDAQKATHLRSCALTSIGAQSRRPERTQSWFLRRSAIWIASHTPASASTIVKAKAARLTIMRWR